ncbi:MAG TPA: hypothetical protein VIU43_00055 [Nitrosospira sp.]
MWRPNTVFIRGEQKDGLIVPPALNTELQGDVGTAGQLMGVTLSTDPGEGKLSFAQSRVQVSLGAVNPLNLLYRWCISRETGVCPLFPGFR